MKAVECMHALKGLVLSCASHSGNKGRWSAGESMRQHGSTPAQVANRSRQAESISTEMVKIVLNTDLSK